MCMDCWQEYGSPRIVNERTLAAVPLIEAVYEHHCAAGGLHVLLDDWNLEYLEDRYGSNKDTPDEIEAENKCLHAFRSMSIEERASALAMYDRYFEP